MADCFAAIEIIAEQRIREAQERGEFDNLPGEGRPLPEDDLAHVAPELRLAYRILKNAHCLPPELAERKEIVQTVELLENCPDEKRRFQAMKRLRVLLDRLGANRHAAMESQAAYYEKALSVLEKHERRAGVWPGEL